MTTCSLVSIERGCKERRPVHNVVELQQALTLKCHESTKLNVCSQLDSILLRDWLGVGVGKTGLLSDSGLERDVDNPLSTCMLILPMTCRCGACNTGRIAEANPNTESKEEQIKSVSLA